MAQRPFRGASRHSGDHPATVAAPVAPDPRQSEFRIGRNGAGIRSGARADRGLAGRHRRGGAHDSRQAAALGARIDAGRVLGYRSVHRARGGSLGERVPALVHQLQARRRFQQRPEPHHRRASGEPGPGARGHGVLARHDAHVFRSRGAERGRGRRGRLPLGVENVERAPARLWQTAVEPVRRRLRRGAGQGRRLGRGRPDRRSDPAGEAHVRIRRWRGLADEPRARILSPGAERQRTSRQLLRFREGPARPAGRRGVPQRSHPAAPSRPARAAVHRDTRAASQPRGWLATVPRDAAQHRPSAPRPARPARQASHPLPQPLRLSQPLQRADHRGVHRRAGHGLEPSATLQPRPVRAHAHGFPGLLAHVAARHAAPFGRVPARESGLSKHPGRGLRVRLLRAESGLDPERAALA